MAVTYNHTPDGSERNAVGLQFGQLAFDRPIKGLDGAKDLGLQGLTADLPDVTGMFNVRWSGGPLSGLSGGGECNPCNFTPNHTYQQDISWFRGRHSVKTGF